MTKNNRFIEQKINNDKTKIFIMRTDGSNVR